MASNWEPVLFTFTFLQFFLNLLLRVSSGARRLASYPGSFDEGRQKSLDTRLGFEANCACESENKLSVNCMSY